VTFLYHAPTTLAEALELVTELGLSGRVLAGGTDLMVQYLRREIRPEHVVYIGGLDELRPRSFDGRLHFGALVTHRELAEDHLVRQELPALAEAAAQVGGWQTQNIGTVGGNLCNASPAADLPPPLLLGNADVTLRSLQGERSVPLQEFLLGRRQTVLEPGELLVSVTVDRPPAGSVEAYVKLGRRRAMEIAIVGLAMRLSFDSHVKEVVDARVAVCAASPRPYRAHDAERVLIGSRLERAALDEAGELVAASAAPVDDVRASANYRRAVIQSLVVRAAERCQQRTTFDEGSVSP
jgi:carbon-monoxide dehydrogenase medium subunit